MTLVLLLVLGSIGAWGFKGIQTLGAQIKQAKAKLLGSQGQGNGPALLGSQGSNGSGLFQFQQSEDGSLLLQSKAASTPAILTTPAPMGTSMPDDVRDWLEHLRMVEIKRAEVANRQVMSAMGMFMDLKSLASGDNAALLDEGEGSDPNANRDPQAPGKVAQDASSMKLEWSQLMRAFDSKDAPAECMEMKRSYGPCAERNGRHDPGDRVNRRKRGRRPHGRSWKASIHDRHQRQPNRHLCQNC